MDDDAKTAHALVLEKRLIEQKLALAGGDDFRFLLQDCSDLSGIMDEIEDVSRQLGEKEHAAFESKVKFSRKMRRKAKDMKNFEQQLANEYENGRISLEHGKKMVSIIKLLRSKNLDKAKREAEEFRGFLEMGARLEIIRDLLLKKRAHVERQKRAVESQLSDLEWLEKGPPADEKMAERHIEQAQLKEKLSKIWSSHAQTLKTMPMGALLKKMRVERLWELGFPEITGQDAESMGAFLQKSGLVASSAEQLFELAGQSEQKLRHLGLDLPAFRQEVAARKGFLSGIMSFSADSHQPAIGLPALAYLSKHDESARNLAGRLAELQKTAEQDAKEWERANTIRQTSARLAGEDKAALNKSLQELRELEDVLDGKAAPEDAKPADAGEKKAGKGLVGSILKLLGGN